MSNKRECQQQWTFSRQLNRRTFLEALGSGVLALGTSGLPGIGDAIADDRNGDRGGRRFFLHEESFGRMFPQLDPFSQASAKLNAALLDIGKPGGILDAKDDLAAGPVALIVDPALNVNNPNNPPTPRAPRSWVSSWTTT